MQTGSTAVQAPASFRPSPNTARQAGDNDRQRRRRAECSHREYVPAQHGDQRGGPALRDANLARQLSLDANDPVHRRIADLLDGNPAESVDRVCRAMEISEAASLSSYSRMTIYRALKAGVLRSVTPIPGGRQRILESDLLAWLRGSRPISATGHADQTRIGR